MPEYPRHPSPSWCSVVRCLLPSGLAALGLAAGCDGDDDGGTRIRLDRTELAVASCEDVRLEATVEGALSPLRFATRGYPLLQVDADAPTAADRVVPIRFRAPSVARPERFVLEVRTGPGGRPRAEVTVTVEPTGANEPGLAEDMVPDCAPFRHGVASGDPTSDGVVLWTRITPPTPDVPVAVRWELDRTAAFADPTMGEVTARPEADHTVRVQVAGLEPGTTYYYRFLDPDERPSAMGRTRTAPSGNVDRLRFAVASCSSVYSGWFNAYRRIADRRDLDLVIHLGDYIYDFVDQDERIRVPSPEPVDPANLDEWRGRHAYYAMDPDFRLARRMHPWFILWDNHDVEGTPENDFTGSVQAFREWTPMRQPDPEDPTVAYRTLRFGSLADVSMMDILLFRNRETLPGSDGAPSILGNAQFEWLRGQLVESQATWHLLGNQKLLSGLLEALGGLLGGWDSGFSAARQRFYGMLQEEDVENLLVLSGDAHVSIANDLVLDPASYDPTTGAGALGAEFLPTSISRGNFDEELGRTETAFALAEAARQSGIASNPHNAYMELVEHGYGLLDITRGRIVAEYWYVPILEPSGEERFATGLVVERGANRWSRTPRTEPTESR